jgi:hypothetical protein
MSDADQAEVVTSDAAEPVQPVQPAEPVQILPRRPLAFIVDAGATCEGDSCTF